MWEFRVTPDIASNYELGVALTVELFEAGQKVDVRGTTIGRGFAGILVRILPLHSQCSPGVFTRNAQMSFAETLCLG